MTPAEWRALMGMWSKDIRATKLVQQLDEAERELEFLGFEGATEEEIARLEEGLGLAVPPSYRNFLKATNGFGVISPFIYRLRPAAEVDWFRVENEGWAATWNETPTSDSNDPMLSDEAYFDYANASDIHLRTEHLWSALQVSDVGDSGVMLLNPMVVTSDGEWEAWFLANWIPGAYRYPSFAHMMVETYREMRRLEKLPGVREFPVLATPAPKAPRHALVEAPTPRKTKKKPRAARNAATRKMDELMDEVHREKKHLPAPPEWFKLLGDLRHADAKVRAKTLKVLQGKLRGRAFSDRYPDLVPLAAELAQTLEDPSARCCCISVLTEIAPDEAAPKWLMAALNDANPWVQHAGVSALFYFKDLTMVEPLLRILVTAESPFAAADAAMHLAELHDERAIPALGARLEAPAPMIEGGSASARAQLALQYYGRIALALAAFGSAAVPRLIPMLKHTDPKRRSAAIIGLRQIQDKDAIGKVMELKHDPDPEVRRQVEFCERLTE